METVLPGSPATTTTTSGNATMTVDPALRLRTVPCKKRPLSWYKPPVSPVNLVSPVSPVNLVRLPDTMSLFNYAGLVSPVSPPSPANPVSPRSPASPTSSSSSHEDVAAGLALSSSAESPTVSPTTAPCAFMWPRGAPLLPASTAVLHAVACSLVTTSTLASHASTLSTASTARPACTSARRQSDFSIEHILRDAGSTRTPPPTSPALSVSSATAHPEGHFEWLQCTRYRPPKLPRSRRRDGPAQRRLGRNPRIPFSPQQVAVLEGRFRRSHYLSSADVAELSAQLELSETRVKIWFQNRRARERRDGEGRSNASPPQTVMTLMTPTRASVHANAPAPTQLPRSSVSAFSIPKSQSMLENEKDFPQMGCLQ